jgi:2-polyprenyl-3-methyl-5-hydroxy-6-metoxy-1,4-benzoquinol methylase
MPTDLGRSGRRRDVVLSDFRAPPAELVGTFDVVISFGVLEHFDDTAGALQHAAALLRHDGLLVTCMSNLAGRVGCLMRALNRRVCDIPVRSYASGYSRRTARLVCS